MWTKQEPVKSSGPACLVCGCGAHDTLGMDRIIAVGFGDAAAYKDDHCVYIESETEGEEGWWTVQMVEDLAKEDPDHDWRISFYAPLYDAIYQRHGDGHWVLIEKGMGFA